MAGLSGRLHRCLPARGGGRTGTGVKVPQPAGRGPGSARNLRRGGDAAGSVVKRLLREVLHLRVRAREDQGLVPVVGPADEVRRAAISSVHLEHLAVAHGFVHVQAAYDDSVTYGGIHAAGLLRWASWGIAVRERLPQGPPPCAPAAPLRVVRPWGALNGCTPWGGRLVPAEGDPHR